MLFGHHVAAAIRGAFVSFAFVVSASARVAALADEPAIFSSEMGERKDVSSLAFSPEGDWLALGGMHGDLSMWAANSCLGVREFPKQSGEVRAIAFAPDGKWVATGEAKRLRLWTLDRIAEANPEGAKKPLAAIEPAGENTLEALAFSADSKTLYAGIRDDALLVWDVASLASGTISKPRSIAHEHAIRCIAIAKDGKTLATGAEEGTVRLFDLPDWKERRTWKSDGKISALAFAADGRAIFVAAGESLAAIETATGTPRPTFGDKGRIAARVTSLAIQLDGAKLVAGTQEGGVLLIDATTGASEKLEIHGGPIMCIAVAPDGHLVASASRDSGVKISIVNSR